MNIVIESKMTRAKLATIREYLDKQGGYEQCVAAVHKAMFLMSEMEKRIKYQDVDFGSLEVDDVYKIILNSVMLILVKVLIWRGILLMMSF